MRVNQSEHPTRNHPFGEVFRKDTRLVFVASPAQDKHSFGDHDSCSVHKTLGDGWLDRQTTQLPNEEED